VPRGLEISNPPSKIIYKPILMSCVLFVPIADESDVQGVWRAGGWIPFRSLHMRGLQGEFDVGINLNSI